MLGTTPTVHYSILLQLNVSMQLYAMTIMLMYLVVFFGNQFLKIGTTLAPGYNIYGLGEHKTSLRLK